MTTCTIAATASATDSTCGHNVLEDVSSTVIRWFDSVRRLRFGLLPVHARDPELFGPRAVLLCDAVHLRDAVLLHAAVFLCHAALFGPRAVLLRDDVLLRDAVLFRDAVHLRDAVFLRDAVILCDADTDPVAIG